MENKFDKNFESLSNDAEIRTVFRLLALRNHPDVGGDDDSMKSLIEAYHKALKRVDGSETTSNSGTVFTYRYNEGDEDELVEKIKQLISLKAKNNKDWVIMLIGRWLWVDKTTREDKDLLNKNGANMRWSGDKEMWYWHPSSFKKRFYDGKGDFNMMALKYGYSEINDVKKNESKKSLVASN